MTPYSGSHPYYVHVREAKEWAVGVHGHAYYSSLLLGLDQPTSPFDHSSSPGLECIDSVQYPADGDPPECRDHDLPSFDSRTRCSSCMSMDHDIHTLNCIAFPSATSTDSTPATFSGVTDVTSPSGSLFSESLSPRSATSKLPVWRLALQEQCILLCIASYLNISDMLMLQFVSYWWGSIITHFSHRTLVLHLPLDWQLSPSGPDQFIVGAAKKEMAMLLFIHIWDIPMSVHKFILINWIFRSACFFMHSAPDLSNVCTSYRSDIQYTHCFILSRIGKLVESAAWMGRNAYQSALWYRFL